MFQSIKSALFGAATAAVLVAAAAVPAASHAATITLGAADAICTSDANGGNDSTFLAGCGFTGLTEYFKSNRSDGSTVGSHEGTFADDYTATFDPSTEALITWNGPGIIDCPLCLLIAKDGNSTPNWFLFDLGAWNGIDDIKIDPLFYASNPSGQEINQAFSHVAIVGTVIPDDCIPSAENNYCGQQQIPEPGVLPLVALGLVGLGAIGRRRRTV